MSSLEQLRKFEQLFEPLFEKLLAQTTISLTREQKLAQLTYLALLERWNKAYNLTAVRQPEQMLVRHIMDSLVVAPFLRGERFIDVGSGAGLPGIPLAIARPARHFTLLESLGKRLRFLHHIKHTLNLTNVELVESRVERFVPALPFDGIISRAFAALQKMLSVTHHLLGAEGHFYAFKGKWLTLEQELQAIEHPFLITKIIPLQVPGLAEERHLVIATCDHH